MQFWVNPDDARLDDGQTQSVVLDTNRHGVLISGAGTWVMRYNNTAVAGAIINDIDTGVAVKLDNDPDGSGGWRHVMLARPFGASGGTFGGGARLYVDGVALAFRSGAYTDDPADLVLGANTSNPLPSAGTQDFFKGVIDDLEIFALGTSSGSPRTNYGEFNVRTDNEFIARTLAGRIPGDMNASGTVDNADVTAFIANWGDQKIVNNAVLPDITTYNKGDFNMDGEVNLPDWFLLRDNHVNGPSLNLAALLQGAAVPEPAAAALTGIGLLGLRQAARPRGRTRR